MQTLFGILLMIIANAHYVIVFTGIWVLGNGILHDVFILLQRRPFDKELMRLLIDGHILIFSGIIYLLCYNGIKGHEPLAYIISMTVAVFILGYCFIIYKMLPAIGIMMINLITLIWLIAEYSTL